MTKALLISEFLSKVIYFVGQQFPYSKAEFTSSVAEMFLQKCFSQQGLFHAFLYAQLARNAAMDPRNRKSQEWALFFCHMKTVQDINRRFADPETSCDDDNILAVFTLAYHGPVQTGAPVISPSQGPLKDLQLLNIYGGGIESVPMHIEGLTKMVSLRGGASNVRIPGLPERIS